jgi:hypothetical protein
LMGLNGGLIRLNSNLMHAGIRTTEGNQERNADEITSAQLLFTTVSRLAQGYALGDEMNTTATDGAEAIRARLRDKWFGETGKTPFFIQYMRALALADLPLADKGAGMILALFADKKGKCWPGQATIAALARETDRSVRKRTRRLEDGGFAVTETGAGRTTSQYSLSIPAQTLVEIANLMEASEGNHCSAPERNHCSGQRGTSVPPNYSVELPRGNFKKEMAMGHDQTAAAPLKYTEGFSATQDSITATSDGCPFRTDASLSDFPGTAAGSEIEDFQEMALAMKAKDDNSILAPVLFRDTAYAELAAISARHGVRHVEQAIKDVVVQSRTGGKMRRGGVRSWKYIEKKAADYRKKDDVAKAGLAPGDVFGMKFEANDDLN